MKIVTARQMRELDRQTIALDKISQGTLMRRAGAAVAETAKRMLRPRSLVMALAGPGNNGGDAVIAGNLLKRAGHRVDQLQLPIRNLKANIQHIFKGVDLVIDGLFGTGLARPVRGEFRDAIEALNRARRANPDLKVLSVDIPSGLNTDTGKPMGAAVAADVTVTFGLPKIGLIQQSAIDLVGRLIVADLGFSPARIASIKTSLEYWTAAEARRLMRPRKPGSFKNDFGHVLVVAGSEGLHGAAWIAAHGALAAGAGLVTLAVPRSIYGIVASQCRQVMVSPVEDAEEGFFNDASWDSIEPLLARKTAFVIGPGFGRAKGTKLFLGKLLAALRAPAILDADALTLLGPELKGCNAALVLTPHPGEMARLTGTTSQKIQADRLRAAASFASKRGIVLALKGARTVVAEPAGSLSINSTGNAALASGGTGDVLSGVIGALLGQGMAPADAARLGVFVHGLAAERRVPDPVAHGIKVEELLSEIPAALDWILAR